MGVTVDSEATVKEIMEAARPVVGLTEQEEFVAIDWAACTSGYSSSSQDLVGSTKVRCLRDGWVAPVRACKG